MPFAIFEMPTLKCLTQCSVRRAERSEARLGRWDRLKCCVLMVFDITLPISYCRTEDICFAAIKGRVLVNGRYEAEIESLTGRRLTVKKMGRPSRLRSGQALLVWGREKQINNLSLFWPRLLYGYGGIPHGKNQVVTRCENGAGMLNVA